MLLLLPTLSATTELPTLSVGAGDAGGAGGAGGVDGVCRRDI